MGGMLRLVAGYLINMIAVGPEGHERFPNEKQPAGPGMGFLNRQAAMVATAVWR